MRASCPGRPVEGGFPSRGQPRFAMFTEGERRGGSPNCSCQSTTQGRRVLRGKRSLPLGDSTALLFEDTQTLQMLVGDGTATGPNDGLQFGDVGLEHGWLLVGCAIGAHVDWNLCAPESDKLLADRFVVPESRGRGVLDHDTNSSFPAAFQKPDGAMSHGHADAINMAPNSSRGSCPAPARTRCSKMNHPDEATTYPSVDDVDGLRSRHIKMRPVEEVDGD